MIFNFNKAAASYDDFASVQKQSSVDLVNLCQGAIENGTKILDVGCGTGLTALAMGEFYPNAEYVLCDIAEDMVAMAQKKIKNARYITCDAENYDFKGPFDICISNLAVQWFKNFERFLQKILTRCKYFVFSALLKDSFKEYRALFEDSKPLSHNDYPSLKEIHKSCKKYGKVLKYDLKEYSLKFPNALSAAKYFKNIGAHIHGKESFRKNASILMTHKKEITLRYKVFFAIVSPILP